MYSVYTVVCTRIRTNYREIFCNTRGDYQITATNLEFSVDNLSPATAAVNISSYCDIV